ncbi:MULTISPECIES: thiamine diphosphokinase [Chryseobacterium]|uniref:Thiamine diphosphokinase n=1 Tax=Chryseobacterium camelliae TaxID=1265445 RepID=A0ABU0TDL9_9FLAO|nr:MULTISPECIES: thiamine diphosphokinase [Chryseobacterium]MDT3407038.1 thiamine pyrophosphokinase [Pseudacidovorax intermedius]MDQ1095170.1 thiamine pyrophosphokinase [Chryseobacterium camelliae]MDQ1099108.1 thiamine pyrophosphokinase [Chryseobacterium sp. SORGH_AS_1048]MDR6086457.1 thiamine pyrophosphokinase [Chryseobacterium sp. SORGH_AS_0909]MDR6130829.1 thiamine pyrophosphokinase [Chryseobacterium sp. SORGH_AS_1175]
MNRKNTGIRMSGKALLFINGEAPKSLPDPEFYGLIACTDGAFHYLKRQHFPLEKLDFISGDFDSHTGNDENVYQDKFIFTPDQNKTDFHKALEIILQKGFTEVDVLGGSGGEQDHFLGNLTVAYMFKDRMNILFYDEFSEYFFIPKNFSLTGIQGRMVSLYPFPSADHIVTKGLNWPLENEALNITSRLGTRNFAAENEISVSYETGDLLIFIGKPYY